jgi:toxin ParE1/3/4
MPQLRSRYTESAFQYLNDIYNYLRTRNEQAANAVLVSIEHSAEILAEFPNSARPTDLQGVRVKKLPRFPFQIFYSFDDEELLVLRVLHERRKAAE